MQRKGSFSVTGIVLTTISVAFVLAGAIALYIRYRRTRRASSAQEPRPTHQPRESRLKSVWILVARHRRRGQAVSAQEKPKPVEGIRAHSRGQSYATTSSKGDIVELDISDVQWTDSAAWVHPPPFERQHTALSISLEHVDQIATPADAGHTRAQYGPTSTPRNLPPSVQGYISRPAPTSFAQRPPLVNSHSVAGSTLSIPRIVIGGSPLPSPTRTAFLSTVPRRPGNLSRHGSEAPSLADSVPRTVTPTEELDEDMLMMGSP